MRGPPNCRMTEADEKEEKQMIRALYSASSGMQAQQLNMDAISNNLANVNTTGYKKSRVEFQDLLYSTIRQPGEVVQNGQVLPTGFQIGLGVRSTETQTLFSQGNLQQTDNPMDLAIAGDGFFQVAKGDQLFYSRDGLFKVDGQGRLVSSDGYILQPAITFPEGAQEFSVAEDGTVSARTGTDKEFQALGKIQLHRFVNPAGLNKIGQNLFGETSASGVATEDLASSVKSGFLEMSNVQVTEEMVKMIIAQRAYEVNSKAIQTSDEMLGIASSLRR